MSRPALTFIGAGNMANSLIGGLCSKGFPASRITAADPDKDNLNHVRRLHGVNTQTDNARAVAKAEVIVLAVKPQILKLVAEELRPHLAERQPLIISIAAGINLTSLASWLGDDLPIVRAMPNTPSLVRTGATGLFANARVDDGQRQIAYDVLASVGLALWVDSEAQLDAVTAVSGSGPAYFYLLMEAIQDAGVKLGLEPAVARQLTLQTALGAAQMAISSDVDVAELRRRVTSPGGTTEKAIASFERDDFRRIVASALGAAAERAATLAQELGEDS